VKSPLANYCRNPQISLTQNLSVPGLAVHQTLELLCPSKDEIWQSSESDLTISSNRRHIPAKHITNVTRHSRWWPQCNITSSTVPQSVQLVMAFYTWNSVQSTAVTNANTATWFNAHQVKSLDYTTFLPQIWACIFTQLVQLVLIQLNCGGYRMSVANRTLHWKPTCAGWGFGMSTCRTGSQFEWMVLCSLYGPSKLAITSDILYAHMAVPRRLFLHNDDHHMHVNI